MFRHTELSRSIKTVAEAREAHAKALADWKPERPDVFTAKKLGETAEELARAERERDDIENEFSRRLVSAIFDIAQDRTDVSTLLPGSIAGLDEETDGLTKELFSDLWAYGSSSLGLSTKGAALTNAIMRELRKD